MQLGSLNRQTLSLHPGDEPIAGFRLIRFRGRGGFGEVWEAEAPGQFLVALKFVRLSSQGRVAEQRALDFVRGIHHPNLLANFGSWQIGETLVIGMELADGSLWDRFLEATQIGDRGIPRGELLGYLSDVAAGVDYLNGYSHTVEGRPSMGVQHRDLKPPNILLFGGGAKVADLGMARAMEGEVAGHTGVWTFPYAAPEFFRGETTRQSDQYGLAVTYCQLRGGRLPFGGNAASVTAGHLFAEPNLDALPEAERPIVARALAKEAGDRWPNCRAFVDALRALPGDALPDRLVGPADLADLSDESLILASGDSHFVPNDSGSGLMAIQSGWLPDTADSGSAFAVMPGAPSSDHVSSAPLVGHDFSLWSSFEAKLVLPAEPANSWVDDGSLPRNRPARSLLRRVGTASLLGFALVAVATSGFQSGPQAGRKSADSPLVATRVTAPSVALTDEAGVELPTPPGTETITQPEPESVILATSPIGRAEIKSEESLSRVSTDEATRSSPDVVNLQTALDTSPVVVPEVRPGLILEGPREMEDSPPFALATIPDRVQPTPPAQVLRPPALVTSNPPTPRIASTAPVVTPSQDQAPRRTRISLADLGQAGPAPAEAAYARGRELFRRSDFLGAIRAFDEAIRLNPGHATSHFARAITRDRRATRAPR